MTKIAIEKVSKVFGPDPKSVLPLIEQGLGKNEILEQTGHVVGIRDISLSVEEGETFVVMGLSGSGKSTLIRHLNRLIEPTSGRILVNGDDVLQLDEEQLRDLRRHKLSMVFQRFGLLPHRSVLDNVAYGLVTAGTPKKEARERAAKQIELVGLGGFEDRFPRQLSGGMQQRVGLARALATDPENLLMDEAFSALDPLIRNDMQMQLKDLQKSLNKTIVFITHDLDEALLLGDHIAILKDGELRQVGEGADILLNPADEYVERFVHDVNRGRVITLGSLAEPAALLDQDDCNRDTIREGLSEHLAVVCTNGSGEHRIVTRRFAEAHAGDAESWWRTPDNLPVARTVEAGATIDEGLPTVSETETPVVVVDAKGAPKGVLTGPRVLKALARPELVMSEE